MLAQIVPRAADREHAKARCRKIALDVGRKDSPSLRRIKFLLDGSGIGTAGGDRRAMRAPILQKHRERRRTAAFPGLFYVGHIEPHASAFLGRRWNGASQEKG